MAEEQNPSGTDIEQLKKELADIKSEMMRKELEEIKREKMRKELEDIKAEKAQETAPQQYFVPYVPRLSYLTAAMAVATLLVAGYVIGTLYPYNLVPDIEKLLIQFSLPISGSIVLTIAAVVLAFIGVGFVTMVNR